eukprot:CAMPEP_0172385464 /NCGR_PEP_ID=MMETSP1061-20121228/3139_1 /TAXON_ID=37318 /ORGANISM="Pseudo-nitzschia pungens, Strain cf. pungens" /LENGTH=392 /DNA_ID=CAMNT_0013114505 /DNA_START=187 /DNA_END=1365 /DNA_ORIENTATION=-
MARSEEAILRRAQKRRRTEGEQRYADRIDMNRQALKPKEKPRSGSRSPDPKQKRLGNSNNSNSNNKRRCVSSPNTPTRETENVDDNQNNQTNATKAASTSRGESPAAARSGDRGGNPVPVPVPVETDDPMKEPGAWICPKCQNSNFASRRYCNSKTCDQVRPFGDANAKAKADRPKPRRNTKLSEKKKPPKPTRHDPETSKQLVWSKQADSKAVSKNQELRRIYRETGGEGMDPEDLQRAKLLIARDERKRDKKKGRKSTPVAENATGAGSNADANVNDVNDVNGTAAAAAAAAAANEGNTTPNISSSLPPTTDPTVVGKENEGSPVLEKKRRKEKSSQAQAKRDQNKALRQLYARTGGKGMKPELIERAKLLVARDEKKQKRKAEQKAAIQ